MSFLLEPYGLLVSFRRHKFIWCEGRFLDFDNANSFSVFTVSNVCVVSGVDFDRFLLFL